MTRLLIVLVLALAAPVAHATLRVFACEPEWDALVRELGGDSVEVYAASTAQQDPHRIQARPSGARILKASIRWLVSGTPIQNRKKDFYNLCKMIRLPASYYTESKNLMELTRNFIMKRTKKQVGIILPDVIQDKN